MHHLLVMSITAVSTMSTAVTLVLSFTVIPSRYIRMFAIASTNFGVTNYDYMWQPHVWKMYTFVDKMIFWNYISLMSSHIHENKFIMNLLHCNLVQINLAT